MRPPLLAFFALLLLLPSQTAFAAPLPVEAVRLLPLYGNDQNTSVGQELAAPITFQVATSTGSGVPRTPLRIRVTGDAQILSSPSDLVSDTYGYVNVRLAGGSKLGKYEVLASFEGLATPVATSFYVLPFTRLSPRLLTSRPHASDSLDAAGKGIFIGNSSTGPYTPARWKAFSLDNGADSATEISFPENAPGGAISFSTNDNEGNLHFIYSVEDSAIPTLRYTKLSQGVFSTPLDVPVRPSEITDGEIVAGPSGVDMVFSSNLFQLKTVHISPEGTVVLGQLTDEVTTASWPSVAQTGSGPAYSYTSFDAEGAHLFMVTGSSKVEIPSVGAGSSQLVAYKDRLALTFVDSSLLITFVDLTAGAVGSITPTGLPTYSLGDPGRVVLNGDTLHILVAQGGHIAATHSPATSTPLIFTHPTSLDIPYADSVENVYFGSRLDGNKLLPTLLTIRNSSQGGANVYVIGLDLDCTCQK